MLQGDSAIRTALARVGELLEARGAQYHIAIIGGAAINLLGIVTRATTDVDILAFGRPGRSGVRLLPPEEPLPEPIRAAAATVARDLGLAPDWLNTGPASQWRTGLPPGLETRVLWEAFGGLVVGVVGRRDLVFFKLYAAADDRGPESVHYQDLLALAPTGEELALAADWIRRQDPSPGMATVLRKVIEHVRSSRG